VRAADHLSVETMARAIGGGLEPEEVGSAVLPHLVSRCAACRQTHARLARLLRSSHHCDLVTMYLEDEQVPGLWARLEKLPLDEQLSLVAQDEDFHNWMLCRAIAQQSLAAVTDRSPAAVPLATLALAVSRQLGSDYDDDWVHDLRVECLAYLAHARRAQGDLPGAQQDFAQARAQHASAGTGSNRLTADLDRLEALLHRDLGDFPKVVALFASALAVFAGDHPEDRDPALAREVRAQLTACRRLSEREPKPARTRSRRAPGGSARASADRAMLRRHS